MTLNRQNSDGVLREDRSRTGISKESRPWTKIDSMVRQERSHLTDGTRLRGTVSAKGKSFLKKERTGSIFVCGTACCLCRSSARGRHRAVSRAARAAAASASPYPPRDVT
ncbi:hypothetical protein EVAR_5623_1 [Eumeta japonica]|uniref:Uncharacterized protein n=1 Tax=Eumeta variegata TaxID=151549 RepID=A0A4C1TAH3_EUMVA|nr:hypothetical protein EVAR_5623_1 [Eumeta japonica]